MLDRVFFVNVLVLTAIGLGFYLAMFWVGNRLRGTPWIKKALAHKYFSHALWAIWGLAVGAVSVVLRLIQNTFGADQPLSADVALIVLLCSSSPLSGWVGAFFLYCLQLFAFFGYSDDALTRASGFMLIFVFVCAAIFFALRRLGSVSAWRFAFAVVPATLVLMAIGYAIVPQTMIAPALLLP